MGVRRVAMAVQTATTHAGGGTGLPTRSGQWVRPANRPSHSQDEGGVTLATYDEPKLYWPPEWWCYPVPIEQRPYCCPVCGGCGTVPPDFYGCLGVGTNCSRETCRTCGGTGVLWH